MPARRWMAVLTERDFRLLFGGQVTSQIGTCMAPVAVAFAVLDHGSASDVGFVLAAGIAPLLVFLLVGGVVADRFGRRRVMLIADVLRGAAQLVLGAWILTGQPPLWGFLLMAALVGTGQAFFNPALTGLLPQLLAPEQLQQGNALVGLSQSVGQVAGPAIAGAIVAVSTPGWAIVADAASYLLSALALGLLRPSSQVAVDAASVMGQMRQGWIEFWSRTWLWVVVVAFALINALIAPYLVLGPAIFKGASGGAAAWGAVLAAEGAGAVVGGIAMLRIHPTRPLVWAGVAVIPSAAPLLALGVRASTVLVALCALAAGVGVAIFLVLWTTTMQREIPDHLLSRLSAYDWFGSLILLPVGMAIAGPVASVIGDTPVLVGCGIGVLGVVVAVLLVPSIRSLRAPRPQGHAAGREVIADGGSHTQHL